MIAFFPTLVDNNKFLLDFGGHTLKRGYKLKENVAIIKITIIVAIRFSLLYQCQNELIDS
jgi:hypothetical protein